MPGDMNAFVEDDMDLFDETEHVTFRKLGEDDAFTDTDEVLALGRAERHEYRSIGGGRQSVTSRTWHLKAKDLPDGTVVEHGDQIVTHAGVTYLVESADAQTWRTRWRCETIRQREGA